MGNLFKKLATAILIISLTLVIEAQNSITWPVRHSMPDNPVVLPEVGPTGAANITIPLWEIKTRGITIPIFLNYVTTGIRVNDISSQVGLGWTINTGPSITRSVNGLADESGEAEPGHDWFSLDPLSISCKLDSLRNYFEGTWDFGPDIFSYSLPGASGAFLFDNLGEMHHTNANNSKIEVDWNYTDITFGRCPGFSASDNLGNTIIFRATETTSTTTNKDLDSNHSSEGLEFLAPRNTTFDGERVTAWGPDRIVTTVGDTIRYTYKGYSYTSGVYLIGTAYAAYQVPTCDTVAEGGIREEYWRTSVEETFNILMVDSIVGPDVVIVFHYSDDSSLSVFKRRLDSIDILDGETGERISSYGFVYGTFQGDLRLKLDSLNVCGGTSNSTPLHYSFNYVPGTLYSIGHYGQDFYGYQNSNQVEHSIPFLSIQYSSRDLTSFEYTPADRKIDADLIKNGVLERIKYPYGGQLELTYEPNTDSVSSQVIRQAPGLRVNSIKARSKAGATLANYKFNYVGINGFYILASNYYNHLNPNGVSFSEYSGGGGVSPHYTYYRYSSNPIQRLLTGLTGGFYYQEVSRYVLDPVTSDTMHFNTDTYTGGRTLRSNRPELLSRLYYDQQGRKVTEESFSYASFRDTTIYGLRQGPSFLFTGNHYECGITQVTSTPCIPGGGKMYYAMDTIPYYLKNRLLNEHVTKHYTYHQTSGDTLTNTLQVEYDYSDILPLVSLVTKRHYAHSQSQEYTTELKEYRYPFNYADTVQVAAALLNNNILARALDTRTYLNGKLTEARTFSFKETGQPDSEYRYTGTSDTIIWSRDSLL